MMRKGRGGGEKLLSSPSVNIVVVVARETEVSEKGEMRQVGGICVMVSPV